MGKRTCKSTYWEDMFNYINDNDLRDSYIPIKLIFQLRNELPIRKILGKTDNDKTLMLEETANSYKIRVYGYQGKYDYAKNRETKFNLLLSDGKKSKLISSYEAFKKIGKVNFNDEYDEDDIKCLFVKQQRRKQYSFYLNDDEYRYVKLFVERLKEQLKNGNSITD